METKRPTLYMPKCLADVKASPSPIPRRETAARTAARKALNAKLEEAAREIEHLARNMPNWGLALSSAAARVRAKKAEYGQL